MLMLTLDGLKFDKKNVTDYINGEENYFYEFERNIKKTNGTWQLPKSKGLHLNCFEVIISKFLTIMKNRVDQK